MHKHILAEGQWLRLIKQGQWEFVERVNASAVVIILPRFSDGTTVFVEQYRHPIQAGTIEFPAGLVGDEVEFQQESLQQAAERELLEETGYQAANWQWLTQGPPSAGMSTEQIDFFMATDLTAIHQGGGVGDESIICHRIALDDCHHWLETKRQSGLVIDPKVYAGLYWLQNAHKAPKP